MVFRTKLFSRQSFKDMKNKRHDSPEQYAEAFQQMIDAREKWREQVREQEAQFAQ